MTLAEVIRGIEQYNEEESVVYAKRINGAFARHSEAVVIQVQDDDLDLTNEEIAQKQCPGFDYFLEVFLINELLEDLQKEVGFHTTEQHIDRIIHYAENDA